MKNTTYSRNKIIKTEIVAKPRWAESGSIESNERDPGKFVSGNGLFKVGLPARRDPNHKFAARRVTVIDWHRRGRIKYVTTRRGKRGSVGIEAGLPGRIGLNGFGSNRQQQNARY